MADESFFDLYRGLRHVQRDVERWVFAANHAKMTPEEWAALNVKLDEVRSMVTWRLNSTFDSVERGLRAARS